MSFRFALEKRGSKFSNAVTYAVQISQHHRGRARHALLLGGDVMAAMGWSVGDTILVGYGEPGTADFGAIRLLRTKPAKRPGMGVKLRPSSKPGSRSGHFQTAMHCDWISEAKHPAEICPWTKASDGADALDVRLPKWAILPAPAALREVVALVARHVAERAPSPAAPEGYIPIEADGPPCPQRPGCPQLWVSDGQYYCCNAQAGGSDSAGDSAAPPAVSSLPPDEAVSDPPRPDTAGGVVGPELLIAQLSKSERILYEEIVRLCAAGAVMPTLRGLTDLLGLAHSNGVISVLVALEAKDLVRLEGPLGQRVFVNPATGERARPAVTAQPKASDDAAPKPGPAPRTQGQILFALINAAAERGDVSPTYAEMMRAIGKSGPETAIISVTLSVLERRNRIKRFGSGAARIYEIVATGKRTRSPPLQEKAAPAAEVPVCLDCGAARSASSGKLCRPCYLARAEARKTAQPAPAASLPSPPRPVAVSSAPALVPSARETEQRLIEEAVARGKVKRLPDPAAIGAALKHEPLIHDMESAKAWLDKHHRKYAKKGGFTYDIAGATVKQTEFVAHVAALQRALAVKKLGRRSA